MGRIFAVSAFGSPLDARSVTRPPDRSRADRPGERQSVSGHAFGPPSGARRGCSGWSDGSAFYLLLEANIHRVACFLPDRFADVRFDGQLVGAVAHRHERTAKWVAVDGPSHPDEPRSAKELHRVGHDHVGPAALVGTLLQGGGELLVQHTAILSSRGLPSAGNAAAGLRGR